MVGMVVLVGAIVRRIREGVRVQVPIIVGKRDKALRASVGRWEGTTDGNRLGALVSLVFVGRLQMTRFKVGLAVGLKTGGQVPFRRGGNVGSSVAMVGRLVGAR